MTKALLELKDSRQLIAISIPSVAFCLIYLHQLVRLSTYLGLSDPDTTIGARVTYANLIPPRQATGKVNEIKKSITSGP